jgi:hypothetical protein
MCLINLKETQIVQTAACLFGLVEERQLTLDRLIWWRINQLTCSLFSSNSGANIWTFMHDEHMVAWENLENCV